MQIIKSQHEENAKLLLVDIAWEELNVSDTYDNYGQKVDSSDAGDCITLNSLQAVKYWNEDDEEDVEENAGAIGETISAFDYPNSYEKITTELIEGEDYTYQKSIVTGFNYWDGNNHKTIIVADPISDPTYQILEGEEYEKMIAEYENKEQIAFEIGKRSYKSKDFVYTEIDFAGAFEIAEVELIEDYELRNGSIDEAKKNRESEYDQMRENQQRDADKEIEERKAAWEKEENA